MEIKCRPERESLSVITDGDGNRSEQIYHHSSGIEAWLASTEPAGPNVRDTRGLGHT